MLEGFQTLQALAGPPAGAPGVGLHEQTVAKLLLGLALGPSGLLGGVPQPQGGHDRDARDDQGHQGQAQGQAGDRGVAPPPLPQALVPGRPPRPNGPVCQKPAQVLGQLPRGRIPIPGLFGDGLEDDRLQVAGNQRVELAWSRRLFMGDPLDEPAAIGVFERRPQR